MRLSAPIFRLKRRAKMIARDESIPHHEALKRIAQEEGFGSWSLLVAKAAPTNSTQELLDQLMPGDLALLGARPGHGKTVMSLQLIVDAIKVGRQGIFFSLDYTNSQVMSHLQDIGGETVTGSDQFKFDGSDDIAADYIVKQLAFAPSGTIVIVDYLQLLDQKREKPSLMAQVRELKAFARAKGVIIVFLSQIDRSFDQSTKDCPGLDDIRLPNPLDLSLFNMACFLNDGVVRIEKSSLN